MLGYVLGITLVLTVLSPLLFIDVFGDSFNVTFDKTIYDLGDPLTISGRILDGTMPVIAMSVYDPDGKILSANNLEITSEKTFVKTMPLDSPFYDKVGKYLVKLDYGLNSENHYFVIQEDHLAPEILLEDTVDPEIILLYTEQKQYTDKDIIKITGLVSTIDSPTVLIGIYDPFGMPAGFYFGSINSNLEFITNFLVKDGVNFRVDGTYSIKAHYGESDVTSFFEYSKVSKILVEDSLENKIDEHVSEDNQPSQSNEGVDLDKENKIQSEVLSPSSQNNLDSFDNLQVIETKQNKTNESPVTKIILETTEEKIDDLENKVEPTIQEKISINNKIKKENNLTVEDIELGKLLNQIKLECDSSTYTDTIFYYDGMGPALYRLCKFDSSLSFFNDALIDNPNDVEILVNKGSTLGKLGYFSEAIVYYDHAINIDPNFLPAKNNKANALANLGHFNDAILLYREVLEQNPNYLTALKNLDILLSSNLDLFDRSSESNVDTISYEKSLLSEKINSVNYEKQKSSNFFDELGIAFSTLGSLFDFLN